MIEYQFILDHGTGKLWRVRSLTGEAWFARNGKWVKVN